jgi:hypothetical protein
MIISANVVPMQHICWEQMQFVLFIRGKRTDRSFTIDNGSVLMGEVLMMSTVLVTWED